MKTAHMIVCTVLAIALCAQLAHSVTYYTKHDYPRGDKSPGKYDAFHKIYYFDTSDGGQTEISVDRADTTCSVPDGGTASWSLRAISGGGLSMPAASGTIRGVTSFMDRTERVLEKVMKELKITLRPF
jgi:hypothetical protein